MGMLKVDASIRHKHAGCKASRDGQRKAVV